MSYCTDEQCEARINGYCETPIEPPTSKDVDYNMKGRCTCKTCGDWPKNTPEISCMCIGDTYNIDGDCLWSK